MAKENDFFINLLFNPTFTPRDFLEVGLSATNTSLEDKEKYKNLDIVLNNELFLTDNKFDENKFNLFYNFTANNFNNFTIKGSAEGIASSYSAFRNDIFAKTSTNKTEGPETFITKIANPNALSIGFASKNILGAPRKSNREIAEAHLLWDGATNSWVDAPNETPLDNFLNPKVLALYDEDIDINGKTRKDIGFDPQHIKYKKGLKKINPITGEYYYESLNGRSIYGREVLSGWDTLTVDGSKFNKYDFFDSDDIEKSGKGAFVKAAVKIAPALIPTISPWYLGLRVILSTSDLFGKIGKMLPGISSENSTLSWLEGLNKTFTESTSDYGQQHMWSLENLFNLSADVFTLLGEQRWIFKYGAAYLKNGKLGVSKKALDLFLKEEEARIRKMYAAEANTAEEKFINLQILGTSEAQAALEKKIASSEKFGEEFSKLYMTGITVADSFADAKEAGLSDLEATLFTLAYAAGEYGILSTNLGEHILPEIRAEKTKWKNVAKTLASIKEENKDKPTKWYKEIMDFAKQTVKGDYNDSKIARALKANNKTKAMALAVASNALGEGLEEVSEEVWFDMAKTLYNAAAELGLTKTGATIAIEGKNLEDIFNRYALNFVGGLIGGGIAVGLPGFTGGIKDMLGFDMSKKQAYQELVGLIRNGKKDEFLKTISKLEIGNKFKSAIKLSLDEKGNTIWAQGTAEDNEDLANHNILTDVVNWIDKLLTVNGAKIDDNSVLRHLTTDARNLLLYHRVLGNDAVGSSVLASYLQDFNSLSTLIVSEAAKLDALKHPAVDQEGKALKIEELNELAIKEATDKLNNLLKLRNMYLNHEMTKYALPAAIFELSDYISAPYIATNFKDYVKSVEHKTLTELTPERVDELKLQWDAIREGELSDNIRAIHAYFQITLKKFSDHFRNFLEVLKLPNSNYILNIDFIFLNIESGRIGLNVDDDSKGIFVGTPVDIQTNIQNYEASLPQTQDTEYNKNLIVASLLLSALEEIHPELVINVDTGIKRITDKLNLAGYSDDAIVTKELKENPEYVKTPELMEALSLSQVYYPGEEFSSVIKTRALTEALIELLVNYNNEIQDVLKQVPYMSLLTKEFIQNQLFNVLDDEGTLEELLDIIGMEVDTYSLRLSYNNLINNILTTPIDLLADLFLLAVGDKSMKVSELIKLLDSDLRTSANTYNIGDFLYSSEVAGQIDNALKIIELLGAHVLAARNDGASAGNLFGYDTVVNLLIPDSNLIEIDKNTANVLMNDLAKLKDKLLYYQNIFKLNTGLKLQEQNNILTRILVSFLSRLKTIISILPDDWNTKDADGNPALDSLKSLLEKATTFNEIASQTNTNKYTLAREKQNQLEKEYVDICDALYTLFNTEENKKKISEGQLSDIFKHLKLIPNPDSETDTTLIDSKLESFDDRSFLWMLVSNAAVKTRSFYAEYINCLDKRFAPIPAQELAVKMGYSFLLNKPLFKAFAKAYNDKILKELETVNGEALKLKFLKYAYPISKLDNSYAISFFNIFLTEGIPGAGKSTGFETILLKMLETYHEEYLNEVWVVHTNETKAEKFYKGLGITKGKVKFFSKMSYLKRICKSYTPPVVEDGVVKVNLDDLILDEETGLHHYRNETFEEGAEVPSLILFDESTRFSLQELLLSDKFLEKFGISAIATGDYDLTGAVGVVKTADYNLSISTSTDNFAHCPKIGTSMRTDNKIKDFNLLIVRNNKRSIINAIYNNIVPEVSNLKYYENLDKNSSDYGLFGEKIVKADNADSDISLMLDSLKEGEKVYYIYYNTDSPLYSKIEKLKANEAYKDKIEMVNSGDVLGEEGQYYIVDLGDNINLGTDFSNNLNYYNIFYTAISRSRQGSLIIDSSNVRKIASSLQVPELHKSYLGEEAIRIFTQTRVEDIKKFLTGSEEKTKIEGILPTPPSPPAPPGNNVEGEEEGSASEETTNELNNRRVPKITNHSRDTYNLLLHSVPVTETGTLTDEATGKLRLDPKTSSFRKDSLNGLKDLASVSKSMTFKRAMKLKDDIFEHSDDAITVLQRIRELCYHISDPNELSKQILEYLGLDASEYGINFQYMKVLREEDKDITLKSNEKKVFRVFLRNLNEKLVGLYSGEKKKEKATADLRLLFAVNIYHREEKSGKKVRNPVATIPLAIFTSPLTMLYSEGMEIANRIFSICMSKNMGHLGPAMDSMKRILSNMQTATRTKIEADLQKLEDENGLRKGTLTTPKQVDDFIENSKNLLVHFQLYTYTMDKDFVHIFDDDWTLAKFCKSVTGPSISWHEKGTEYWDSSSSAKYQFLNGEFIPIKDLDTSVHSISQDVFYLTKDLKDASNKVIVPAGKPFILISDYYRLESLTSAELKAHLLEELSDNPPHKITPIFVCTPGVTVTDYLTDVAHVLTLKESYVKKTKYRVGNDMTAVHLAELITQDARYKKLMEEEIAEIRSKEKVKDDDKKVIPLSDIRENTWNTFVEVIQQLSTLANGDSKEYMRLLNTENASIPGIKEILLEHASLWITNSSGGNPKLLLYIRLQLMAFVLKAGFTDGKIEFDSANESLLVTDKVLKKLDLVTELWDEKYPHGVLLGVKGKGVENNIPLPNDNLIVPVSLDADYSISIYGIPYYLTLNGKIDTTTHVCEAKELMNTLHTEIENGTGRSMAGMYANGTIPDTIKTGESISIPEDIKKVFPDDESVLINLYLNKTFNSEDNLSTVITKLFETYSIYSYQEKDGITKYKLITRKDPRQVSPYSNILIDSALLYKYDDNTGSTLISLDKNKKDDITAVQNLLDSISDKLTTELKTLLLEFLKPAEEGSGTIKIDLDDTHITSFKDWFSKKIETIFTNSAIRISVGRKVSALTTVESLVKLANDPFLNDTHREKFKELYDMEKNPVNKRCLEILMNKCV